MSAADNISEEQMLHMSTSELDSHGDRRKSRSPFMLGRTVEHKHQAPVWHPPEDEDDE